MDAIMDRLDQVEVERAYRIIGVLEQIARAIEERLVPTLREARRRWKRRTLWLDSVVFGTILAAGFGASVWAGYWQGLGFSAPWFTWLTEHPVVLWLGVGALALAAVYVHFRLRRVAANGVAAAMRSLDFDADSAEWLERAFEHNTRPWQPLFGGEPTGWSASTRKRLAQVLAEADSYVQVLNARFTDPSGNALPRRPRRGDDEQTTASPALEAGTQAPGELEIVKPPADFADEQTDTTAASERR
jgi:hypothetical protein